MVKEFVTERLKLIDLYPDKAKSVAEEYGLKEDEVELIRKGRISEQVSIDRDKRTVINYISTDAIDRDNEIIEHRGVVLDDYKKNPIVPWAHDYRGLPIGKNLWIKPDKKGLVAKTYFLTHPFAEQVFDLYTEDIAKTGPALKAWSVGFIPLKWKDGKPDDKVAENERPTNVRRTYKKWLLLEYSAVPVPSNPEALTLMVEKGLIKDKKLIEGIENYIDDLQQDTAWEEAKERDEAGKAKKFEEDGTPVKEEGESETEEEDKVIHKEDLVGGENTPDHITVGDLTKDETGTPYLYTNEEGTLVTQEEILEEWIEKGTVTKPEEDDDLIRLPVKGEAGKHDGHKIRWITVSDKKGIKGLYCIDDKKIITYVFLKSKGWTMAKAKAWMKDHGKEITTFINRWQDLTKVESITEIGYEALEEQIGFMLEKKGVILFKERWNKSLPKLFDVSEVESPKPRPFAYDLYSKFLDCKIKEIFKNTYSIPSPLIGTYLAGLKEILSRFDLKDTRNFNYDGVEIPPDYEVIRLNSTQSDDFLMNGISFYDADETPLIVKYAAGWNGFDISFITSNQHKEWNKELLDEIHKWAQDNNFLKGEKFSLSGEFLDKSEDGWDNLILKSEMKDVLRKSVNYLTKKKDNLASRGLLFIGPPGTGKTKTGRVLMNKADATFIWVSSRDFRMVGPLRALTLSFSLARQLAPTILFIEDIDTWLKDYGNQDSVVVDLLKTELDGIKQNKGIINILTSNYPEKLPDTLLDRPGRFHHIVNFELPRAEQRKEMLVLWADEIENDLLEKIVKEIEGFSGAHIRELVDYAYIIAEEDDIDIGKAIVESLEKLREQRDLIAEIRENKKSLKQILEENKIMTGKSREPKTEKLIQRLEILADEIRDLKEGRVLSGKNLKLVKECREQIKLTGELLDKLIVASEPPKEESILPLIEDSKGKENITDVNSLTKKDIPIIMEEILKGIKEGMAGQRKKIQGVFDSKLGKVE